MPDVSAKRLADIVFSNKGSQSCSNVVSILSPMQTDNVATVCYCKQQFSNEIGMLKCTADVCANGRYFHVNCLGYKRIPKQEGWVCFGCKAELARLKKRKRSSIDVPNIDN